MAIASFFVFIFLSHLLLIHSAEADDNKPLPLPICPESFQFRCGTNNTISFPFTNISYPNCGFVVDCDQPVQKVHLVSQYPPYDVLAIDGNILHIRDPLLEIHKSEEICNGTFKNLTLPRSDFISFEILNNLTFFKCNNTPPTEDYFSHHNYISYNGCTPYSLYYTYPDYQPTSVKLPDECSVIQLPALWPRTHPPNDGEPPFRLLTTTFRLEFHISNEFCLRCAFKGGKCQHINQKPQCHWKKEGKRNYSLILATGTSAAVSLVVVILLCYFRRKCSLVVSTIFRNKERENHQQLELFLKKYGSLAPKTYSYSDVKKMTNSFEYKLGQGGYGGVYRGKLQNGHLVAVKVLTESKGNGEEFTNEIASISRTSHINIVTLVGFCFEGTKRALIYEFMPNGSLEKFIYDESSSIKRQLGWETLYQIAVGIARGLEYLHRGCNTRILHFDIKPHNILLDENFCPKIADFGLSKLCLKKDSIISMLGARGTFGYIAPELFSRNFGGVSHKSDVYSYGMMVLEMVGGRKNIDVGVDHSSEIYFPHWIYNRVELNKDLGLHGIMNEEENEKAKKMIIVGLWCIQTDPSNRPSINKVMEMLEGSLESLQIPPKPFLSSPSRPPADSSTIQIL